MINYKKGNSVIVKCNGMVGDIMAYSPVVIFGYNRLSHLKRTIDALADNMGAKNTEIFLFLDGFKGAEDKAQVESVHNFGKQLMLDERFEKVNVYIDERNKGLAKSVIQGVSSVIEKYGRVIVLEDDLLTSKDFLPFMNDCLNYYEHCDRIWSISGYTFNLPSLKKADSDVYFGYRAASWGWATWKNRWESIDWDICDYNKFRYNLIERMRFNRGGTNLSDMLDRQMVGDVNSWAVRWCYSQFKQDKLTVFPCKSKVLNIGQDGSGTHSNTIDQYDSSQFGENEYKLLSPKINKKLLKEFKKKTSLRITSRIKRYVYYNLIRRS